METREFKPYDKVLVRDGYGFWGCDLYSHWNEKEKTHCTVGFGSGVYISDEYILPFDEYSYLLGRNESPDEEIVLGEEECLLFTNNKDLKTFCLKPYKGNSDGKFNGEWEYAIRFENFDPYNMEQTKKHFLTIRENKVVRCKE